MSDIPQWTHCTSPNIWLLFMAIIGSAKRMQTPNAIPDCLNMARIHTVDTALAVWPETTFRLDSESSVKIEKCRCHGLEALKLN